MTSLRVQVDIHEKRFVRDVKPRVKFHHVVEMSYNTCFSDDFDDEDFDIDDFDLDNLAAPKSRRPAPSHAEPPSDR